MKSKLYLAVALAVMGVAVAVGLVLSNQSSSPAAPDVFVSGGGHAFRGSAAEALGLTSSRSGLAIPPLKNDKYELRTISLQDDVDGVRLAVQVAQLIYERRGAEPGKGRLSIYHLTGRQSPISGGRRVEPAPVPVANSAGLEIVRVDLSGSVAFTVWRGNVTHDFAFEPPTPNDSEMLAIVLSLFQ